MIVGFMNTFNLLEDLFLTEAPNNHFNTGMRARKGMPFEPELNAFLSIPPNNIISWFLTLIIELKLRLDIPEGASFISLSRGVNSLWVISIFRVTH